MDRGGFHAQGPLIRVSVGLRRKDGPPRGRSASHDWVGLLQMARAHPRMAMGVCAGCGAGISTRRSSSWGASRIALREGAAAIIDEVSSRILAHPAIRQQAAARAIAQLEAYRSAHAPPASPVAIVARTLAIAPLAGMTVKEIYDSTGHRFAARPVLEANSRLFTADAAGRWLLEYLDRARIDGSTSIQGSDCEVHGTWRCDQPLVRIAPRAALWTSSPGTGTQPNGPWRLRVSLSAC